VSMCTAVCVEGAPTGPPTAPRMMASAFFAASSVSSVSGLLCASIEHCVCQSCLDASSCATYTTEEVFLEVERDIRVPLDDLEHLSRVSACLVYLCHVPRTLMPSAMTCEMCELCVTKARMELLPQVRRRHLHGISCIHKSN
jgi:hypothetical protein